ncbi:MAG TPA: glutathione S-transferase domain-containing protein [Polyangia bacterium]|nr:glutathione S-transferase domain-containing protein [Polyangia bacterium]
MQQAKAQLETSYAVLDGEIARKTWALGEDFTLADCSALPALFTATASTRKRRLMPNIP